MKRPQWFDKTPSSVCHPSGTLKDAAKVLAYEAKQLRKARLKASAEVALRCSLALADVAAGKTWQEAFGWSLEDEL